MKSAPLRALVRPVITFAVVVSSACGLPTAPGNSSSAPGSIPSATPARDSRHRTILLSEEGRAGTAQAVPSPKVKTGLGHDVSGPSYLETYSGGPVISNVHVVLVHWADVSDSTNVVNATLAADLPGFYGAITTGPYFSWLAEYNTTPPLSGTNQTIGFGTVDTAGTDTGGAYLITPTINTTKTLDDGYGDGDIGAELDYQISNGFLPPPELDALGNCNSLYVVDFPPGFEVNAFGSSFCSKFCAYHDAFPHGAAFIYVPYAVHPDISSCSSCSGKTTYLETEQFFHSHELIEAVTDAAPDANLAWYDLSVSDGEIADLCATEPGVTVSGYYVTAGWSNANGECIGVAPLCAPGTPSPPSCTPCNGVGAASCAAPTPICDMTSGLCEGCLTDTDCSSPTPICDKATLTCRACKSGDCSGPTPVCSSSGFSAGKCVQCDGASPSQCKGATPVCYTYKSICVGCVLDTDCSGDTPICDTGTQACRACTSNPDCSPNVCDTSSGACVGCLKSSDCGSETCDVATHTCQCTTDAECNNPTPVCGSAKTCVACKTDGDCTGSPAGGACSRGSCVECATSANCSGPTPVCNEKTHRCVAGKGSDGGADSGKPPPGDSGANKSDSGGSDGGTTIGSGGGCSASPMRTDPQPRSLPLLVIAALAGMGVRRRQRQEARHAGISHLS
jgi:hypothetical protein